MIDLVIIRSWRVKMMDKAGSKTKTHRLLKYIYMCRVQGLARYISYLGSVSILRLDG